MPRRDAHAELAHPDVAGWVLGALDPDETGAFAEHLRSCADCQAAVDELEPVARMLRSAAAQTASTADVKPPADLRARALTRVAQAAALAAADTESTGPGEAHGLPEVAHTEPDAETTAPVAGEAGTAVRQAPALAHKTPSPSREAPARGRESPAPAPKGNVVPLRRAGVRTLTLAAAVAAAVAAAITVWVSRPAPALAFSIPLHAAQGETASGQANARQTANGWSITLTVHGLKHLGPGSFYECWYAGPGNGPGHPNLITAGTFTVGRSGDATVQMWSAADPRTFSTMQITAERSGDAAQHGQVFMSGSTRR